MTENCLEGQNFFLSDRLQAHEAHAKPTQSQVFPAIKALQNCQLPAYVHPLKFQAGTLRSSLNVTDVLHLNRQATHGNK